MSDYLANEDLCLQSLIDDSILYPNLHILSSRRIPPNPAELLSQGKMKKRFSELKEGYDFIIVDTAPSMLVADTFLINRYADITLYVVKSGYTEKIQLEFAVKQNNLDLYNT